MLFTLRILKEFINKLIRKTTRTSEKAIKTNKWGPFHLPKFYYFSICWLQTTQNKLHQQMKKTREKKHLFENISKTNEIWTCSLPGWFTGLRQSQIQHWRNHRETHTHPQNTFKTNEILIFSFLGIVALWCFTLCWLFWKHVSSAKHY